MLNFITCDDLKHYRDITKKSIEKALEKKNIKYKIYQFSDYNDEFFNTIEKLDNKIYILDIEVPTMSGIDVARIIRHEEKQSPIIFYTAHDEISINNMLNGYPIVCVNKYSDSKNALLENIKTIVNIYVK